MASDTNKQMDIKAREALIVGKPPRIPPLSPDQFSEEAREIALELRGAAARASGKEDSDLVIEDVPEIVATMLRYPELYRAHLELGILMLGNGTLASRDRELAVLRIGWLCQAPWEWGEHVKIGKNVGLSSDEIERITQGSSAPGWNEHERAILQSVEELLDDSMISDASWEVLTQTFDEKQLMEFVFLVGNYQMIAYSQNALRLRLMPGNKGLAAR